MRTIICGGRHYAEREYAEQRLDSIHAETPITLAITGGATGADAIGKAWAESRGVPHREFPVSDADWKRLGLAAGPIRNGQMLVQGAADRVIAFPGNKGTRDMVRQAKACGLAIVQG